MTTNPPVKFWQSGSCHCGAVSFEVLHQSLYDSEVTCCNCSNCSKAGYLLIKVERSDIKWLSGLDEMKTYKFGTKILDHRFCGTCGNSVCVDHLVKMMPGMGDVVGMNVRLMKDIDIEKLKVKKLNGKDWSPEAKE